MRMLLSRVVLGRFLPERSKYMVTTPSTVRARTRVMEKTLLVKRIYESSFVSVGEISTASIAQ